MGTTWPCFNIDSQAEYGKKLILCIWWDQLGVVYYELLKPNETITLYRTQLRLNLALKEKRAHYYSRYDKIIVLHDNARHMLQRRSKPRNTQMGSSTPLAIFSRHCSFRLPLPIDDAWPV